MITYLSHPTKGGVHIAYDEDEVKRCEADGWVSHGNRHPNEGKPKAELQVVQAAAANAATEKRKPGRPRKGA